MIGPHPLEVGFVILSIEQNLEHIKCSIRSINRHYGDKTPRLCVIGAKSPISFYKECKALCPTVVRGKSTVASLVNAGMKKGHKTWNILLLAGSRIKPGLAHKYAVFYKDEKDIFFPILPKYNKEGIPVQLNDNFCSASLNGLCIHRDTFMSVGEFEYDDLDMSKTMWGGLALMYGCNFKAIL